MVLPYMPRFAVLRQRLKYIHTGETHSLRSKRDFWPHLTFGITAVRLTINQWLYSSMLVLVTLIVQSLVIQTFPLPSQKGKRLHAGGKKVFIVFWYFSDDNKWKGTEARRGWNRTQKPALYCLYDGLYKCAMSVKWEMFKTSYSPLIEMQIEIADWNEMVIKKSVINRETGMYEHGMRRRAISSLTHTRSLLAQWTCWEWGPSCQPSRYHLHHPHKRPHHHLRPDRYPPPALSWIRHRRLVHILPLRLFFLVERWSQSGLGVIPIHLKRWRLNVKSGTQVADDMNKSVVVWPLTFTLRVSRWPQTQTDASVDG